MIRKNAVILLVAHGSRRAEANQEVEQLAKKLEKSLTRSVIACFLELAEPSIPQGVDQALRQSAEEILVLPYFLTQGRHMEEDIPKILSEKARAYPETPIRILDYVGASPQMIELLEKMVKS